TGAVDFLFGKVTDHDHVSTTLALSALVNVQAEVAQGVQAVLRFLGCYTALDKNRAARTAANAHHIAFHIGCQLKANVELILRLGNKAAQFLVIPHKEIVAVIIAGDEKALSSVCNGNFLMAGAKLIKLLHAMLIGVVRKNGGKPAVILV